ncbi:MAG: hypothetical protein M1819_001631 [Sarea resinae]|nr:MAG: hypothetical protein M1819_001631 [Sarea resinae]
MPTEHSTSPSRPPLTTQKSDDTDETGQLEYLQQQAKPLLPRVDAVRMESQIHIPKFSGANDNADEANEFLEDIELAVSISGLNADVRQNYSRMLFRQHLTSDALQWYRQLENSVRNSWTELRQKFIDDFTKSNAEFTTLDKIVALRQGSMGIREYVDQATLISRNCPATYSAYLARQFVAGMSDKERKRLVTMHLGETAFTFQAAKEAVKRAYMEIGEPSPFDGRPGSKTMGRTQDEINNLLYQALERGMTLSPPAGLVAPQSLPEITNEMGRRGRGAAPSYMTCYNCMEKGHYSDECPHQRVSKLQWDANMQEVARQRDQAKANRPTPKAAPAASAALETNCGILEHDMPAMPVTRTQAQRAHRTGRGQPYEPREIVPPNEQYMELPPSGDRGMRDAPEAPEQHLEYGPNQTGVTPQQQTATQTRNARTTGTRTETRKNFEMPAPIHMLGEGERFDLSAAFNGMHVNLPLSQLLDSSPQLRRQLAYQLQSSIVRRRGPNRARQTATPNQSIPEASNAVPRILKRGEKNEKNEIARPPKIVSEAKDDGTLAKVIYITAWIGEVMTAKALVDSGAVVELISQDLVRRIPGVVEHPTDGNWRIRLANDSTHTLTTYVWIPVNVDGVLTTLRAFVIPGGTGYDLLLSRTWHRRVGCIHNHQSDKITIRGHDGVEHEVGGRSVTAERTDLIVNPEDPSLPLPTALTEDEILADEEVERLIDEIDNHDFLYDQSGKALR